MEAANTHQPNERSHGVHIPGGVLDPAGRLWPFGTGIHIGDAWKEGAVYNDDGHVHVREAAYGANSDLPPLCHAACNREVDVRRATHSTSQATCPDCKAGVRLPSDPPMSTIARLRLAGFVTDISELRRVCQRLRHPADPRYLPPSVPEHLRHAMIEFQWGDPTVGVFSCQCGSLQRQVSANRRRPLPSCAEACSRCNTIPAANLLEAKPRTQSCDLGTNFGGGWRWCKRCGEVPSARYAATPA